MMRLKNGGQAMANIDYLRPKGAVGHGDDRVRIAGSKGVIEVRFNKAYLMDSDGPERELPQEPKVEMFDHFIRWIENEDHPYRQSHEDVFALTELCIEAQEKADKVK